MALNLPIYAVVFNKAVKAVRTEDGGIDVLAYNPVTDEFQRDMTVAHRLFMPDGEVDLVSEAEFEAFIAEQRREHAG